MRIKRDDRIRLYLPENLDLSALVTRIPPTFKFVRDRAAYILDRIYTIPIYDKSKRLNEKNGKHFTPLHSKALEPIVPDYKRYLSYFISPAKVLETDNHYIVKEKAKGYRFTDLYQVTFRAMYASDQNLKKRILKNRYLNKLAHGAHGFTFLRRTLEELSIDEPLFNQALAQLNPSPEQKIQYLISVDKIRNRDIFLKKDDVAGRIHHNLTNLKSEFRKCLTINGKHPKSIDIRNSQPFFSLLLINLLHELYSTNESHKSENCNKLCNISDSYLRYFSDTSLLSILSYVHNSCHLISQADIDKEVRRYTNLAIGGCLYSHLGDLLKQEFGAGIQDRKLLKEQVYILFYSHNKRETPLKPVFKREFPFVDSVFRAAKQKQHNQLAILLQKMEADLMIGRVAKRLGREHPKYRFSTIHDSIVTFDDNANYIAQVIRDESKAFVGEIPSIRIE
jgi:hypothetical protein